MARSEKGTGSWELPVTAGVISGANALFGGCATAAALVAAAALVEGPVFWAGVHFGKLAPNGSMVDVQAQVLVAGRTVSHLSVTGGAAGAESFSARLSAGRRTPATTEGHWRPAPAVSSPDEAAPFEHPVHAGTWAERFEWRLPQFERLAEKPTAAWWVRPREADPPVLVTLAVLADYVTYGVGRALGTPMGGLSVDNSLRIHRAELSEWLLLVVRPEAIAEGIGFGSTHVHNSEGDLLAAGTQTMVLNDWDWRLPSEQDDLAAHG